MDEDFDNVLSRLDLEDRLPFSKLCCGGVVVLFSILLFAFSWSAVEPIQYGLLYSTWSKTCGKEVYTGGRYFIGPLHSFVVFPSTAKTIEFGVSAAADSSPLNTRTKEGLAVTMDISFQYTLRKNGIPDLYAKYNSVYEATIIRIARDVILQVAGSYEAPSYWKERAKIAEAMQGLLNIELHKIHADCIDLQMLVITLPKSYEEAITETQVEAQSVRRAEFEKESQNVRSDTATILATAQANVTVVHSSAEASAYKAKRLAKAEATKNTVAAATTQYKEAMAKLKLKDTELAEYVWWQSIDKHKHAEMLVGLKNNAILNLPSV